MSKNGEHKNQNWNNDEMIQNSRCNLLKTGLDLTFKICFGQNSTDSVWVELTECQIWISNAHKIIKLRRDKKLSLSSNFSFCFVWKMFVFTFHVIHFAVIAGCVDDFALFYYALTPRVNDQIDYLLMRSFWINFQPLYLLLIHRICDFIVLSWDQKKMSNHCFEFYCIVKMKIFDMT